MNRQYKKAKLKVADLQPCELLSELSIPASETYGKELLYWQYYDKPVVTADLRVLWHWENVLAAQATNVLEIDCMVAVDLKEDEVIRFVCTGLHYKDLRYYDRYILIRNVAKYLRTNPEGQKWAEQIPGTHLTTKVGKVVGKSKDHVKQYKRIGDIDPEILKREDELTLKQMTHHIEQLKPILRDKALSKAPTAPVLNRLPDPALATEYVTIYFHKLGRSIDIALYGTGVGGSELYQRQTKDGAGIMTFEVSSIEAWIKEYAGMAGNYRNKLNL